MVLATSAVLLSGCGKKPDAITEAAKEDTKEGIAEPSIAEVKQIAQEGFSTACHTSWATRRRFLGPAGRPDRGLIDPTTQR